MQMGEAAYAAEWLQMGASAYVAPQEYDAIWHLILVRESPAVVNFNSHNSLGASKVCSSIYVDVSRQQYMRRVQILSAGSCDRMCLVLAACRHHHRHCAGACHPE